ncbi:glycosyltransferase family 4 protein [Paenibacillus sp. CAU 1782]
MSKKVLFCATVDYHFRAFHLPTLEWFQQNGWEVHIAARGELELPFVDVKFNVPFSRSPLHRSNLKAYRQLQDLIHREKYDLIHCHTPTAGALARLAARGARRHGTKVVYTAHGFHFHKGAPLANWLLYYPVEKYLAKLTDCLITINNEDYNRAQWGGFRAGQIRHVPGVGVHTGHYAPADSITKGHWRKHYRYSDDDFLLIYAAEFNLNKNHDLLLHALSKLTHKVPQARLLLAGEGSRLEECMALAEKLGILDKVDFLGYRKDMRTLLPIADVAVASSLREGLPVNIMEAMACGLPVVATRNRGHAELVQEGHNGFLVPPEDAEVFASRLHLLFAFKDSRRKMGQLGAERAGNYSLSRVQEELTTIYQSLLSEAGDEAKAESQYRRAYL